MCCVLPVQLRFVFPIEAQQQRVEGKTPDPPASLNRLVLRVLGELQHLQLKLGVVAQTEEAPQGEGELVHHAASTPTQTNNGRSGHTGSDTIKQMSVDECITVKLSHLVFVFMRPLMNSTSFEYMV